MDQPKTPAVELPQYMKRQATEETFPEDPMQGVTPKRHVDGPLNPPEKPIPDFAIPQTGAGGPSTDRTTTPKRAAPVPGLKGSEDLPGDVRPATRPSEEVSVQGEEVEPSLPVEVLMGPNAQHKVQMKRMEITAGLGQREIAYMEGDQRQKRVLASVLRMLGVRLSSINEARQRVILEGMQMGYLAGDESGDVQRMAARLREMSRGIWADDKVGNIILAIYGLRALGEYLNEE